MKAAPDMSKLLKRLLRIDLVDPVEGKTQVEQTDEVREVVGRIKQEFEKRREERRPFELQWRLNQNFLQGNQYCDILSQTGEVVDFPASYDWEMRSVYNQIAPIIETRQAKLSRVQPGLVVRPLTADTEDITTARTSTKLLKATYKGIGMTELLAKGTLWAEVCGSVFYKSVWNPSAGHILGYIDKKPIYEGDIQTTVVPAYELFPDSCYRLGIEKCNSIIHARAYTVQEIYDTWGVLVEGRQLNVFSMDVSGMVSGGSGYNPSMMQTTDNMLDDAELVLEWYERPTRDFPRGRHIVIAGDICVHIGELPFKVGEYFRHGYPFVQQYCLVNPGTFWGSTIIERIIPIQRDYNAVKNRINEHIARMTVGNMLVAQGSLINDEVLDTGLPPGTVLEYAEGSTPPVWMPVADVPEGLFVKLNDMRQEFIEISGVSEMSKTSGVSGLQSGVALEIMKEQDDTRLTLTAENIRKAVAEVGKQWLRLFKQFATEPRIARVSGNDVGDVSTFMWKQNDITSDDVVVDTDNEMSQTPAQRKQMALELMNAGMFIDPDTRQMTRETRAKLMEIFELGNWETVVDMDELHSVRAQRENIELEREIAPQVMQLDNHPLHIQEHTKFALGAEFRRLQERIPELARALLMHIDAHKQIAADQAMRMSGMPSAAGNAANGEPIESALNRAVINQSTNLKGSQPAK